MNRNEIVLVERSASERLSGGYRYNDALTTRLQARGLGRRVAVESPDALMDIQAQTLLIDSLWLQLPAPAALGDHRERAPRQLAILGHWFPPDHPYLTASERSRWLSRAQAWLEASGVVAVTGFSACSSWEKHFPKQRFSVLPPAITIERREGYPKVGPLRLLTVGTPSPAKLPLALLVEMAKLRDREFTWSIVGSLTADPAHVQACRACLQETQLAPRVQFTGPMSAGQTQTAMRDADFYLATSLFESFGMASAEALVTGVPLIGFDAGDLHDWSANDPACALIEAGDHAAFVQRVDTWLQGGREALRKPRTPRLPSANWDVVLDRLLEIVNWAPRSHRQTV